MTLIITRPHLDADSFASKLRGQGLIDIVIAPMLAIRPRLPFPDISDADAVIFTSANGARAFSEAGLVAICPAFAVGPASAEAARAAGFRIAGVGEADVSSLAEVIIREFSGRMNGRLVHLAGAAVAGDLAGRLAAAGIECRREVVYKALPASGIPEDAADALSVGASVAFFSPRTARVFSALAADASIDTRHSDAYCLSESIAEVLAGSQWRRILVASRPVEQSMTELLLDNYKRRGA